jgi:Ca2+-binding RTX toxin-like protein
LEIRLPDPEALAINYRAERLASLYPSDVSVFQLVAGDGGDNRLDGANRDDEIRGLGGADTLVAADGNDSLLGQDDDDLLLGGDGDDTLVGGDGDDTLDGNYGYDSLDGGDGFDTADYSFWIYPIEIDLSNGRADLQVGVTPETLVSMEGAVTGDGNDTLIGSEEDNVLAGGAGSDRIPQRSRRADSSPATAAW